MIQIVDLFSKCCPIRYQLASLLNNHSMFSTIITYLRPFQRQLGFNKWILWWPNLPLTPLPLTRSLKLCVLAQKGATFACWADVFPCRTCLSAQWPFPLPRPLLQAPWWFVWACPLSFSYVQKAERRAPAVSLENFTAWPGATSLLGAVLLEPRSHLDGLADW